MSQRFRRIASLALAVALAALTVSCGGDASSGEPASPFARGGPGAIVFSRPDGIYDFDIKSRETKPLIVAAEPNSFLLDPAVSPDGSKIAYVVQPPSKLVDGRYDAGSDLWIADRDGNGSRRLYEHEQPNALVRYPQWSGDGHVVAIIQEITGSLFSEVAYTIQRIDIATGVREKLIDDALAFALSPDGARISYVRLDAEMREVFESVAIGGGAREVLVAASEHLQPYNSPRYSPDGETIAFAAALQPGAAAGARYVAAWTGYAVAAAAFTAVNGLPQDIWLVDSAGGKPRLLSELQEDLPALTWSGDGKHIYVLGGGGLFDVNLGNGAARRLGDGSFHGQLDWTP